MDMSQVRRTLDDDANETRTSPPLPLSIGSSFQKDVMTNFLNPSIIIRHFDDDRAPLASPLLPMLLSHTPRHTHADIAHHTTHPSLSPSTSLLSPSPFVIFFLHQTSKQKNQTQGPQILEHIVKSVAITSYDTKWVPSSARFVVIGSYPRATGCLQAWGASHHTIPHTPSPAHLHMCHHDEALHSLVFLPLSIQIAVQLSSHRPSQQPPSRGNLQSRE